MFFLNFSMFGDFNIVAQTKFCCRLTLGIEDLSLKMFHLCSYFVYTQV